MKGGTRRGSARGSRLVIATAVAVIAALAMSAAAPAKDQSYDGPIFDSLGKVEFKLEREEGKLYVMDFHVDDLPYTCVNGTGGTIDFGIRRMKVKQRRFGKTTYFGNFRGSKHAVVGGRLRPDGRARGNVFYSNGFDGIGLCESGEMGWSAHK